MLTVSQVFTLPRSRCRCSKCLQGTHFRINCIKRLFIICSLHHSYSHISTTENLFLLQNLVSKFFFLTPPSISFSGKQYVFPGTVKILEGNTYYPFWCWERNLLTLEKAILLSLPVKIEASSIVFIKKLLLFVKNKVVSACRFFAEGWTSWNFQCVTPKLPGLRQKMKTFEDD